MSKDIIILLYITLITIIFWIGLEIHHILSRTFLTPEMQQHMIYLNPDLDIELLTELKEGIK